MDVFVGESTTKLAPWSHVPPNSNAILMGNGPSKKQRKIPPLSSSSPILSVVCVWVGKGGLKVRERKHFLSQLMPA